MEFVWFLLSKSTGGEHLCHKINVPVCRINPGSVEFHYVVVFQGLEQMNFTVQPLQLFRTLQEIIKLHLVPGYFNPFILIEGFVSAKIITGRKKDNPLNGEPENTHSKKATEFQKRGFFKNLRRLCRKVSYTVLEAPLPRISLYCKIAAQKQSIENEENKATKPRKTRRLPFHIYR